MEQKALIQQQDQNQEHQNEGNVDHNNFYKDQNGEATNSRKGKKRKQISDLIEANPQLIDYVRPIFEKMDPKDFDALVGEKVKIQPVRAKDKERQVVVIEKADFEEVVQQIVNQKLPAEFYNLVEPIVYLNQRHNTIYQAKIISFLIHEAAARC